MPIKPIKSTFGFSPRGFLAIKFAQIKSFSAASLAPQGSLGGAIKSTLDEVVCFDASQESLGTFRLKASGREAGDELPSLHLG